MPRELNQGLLSAIRGCASWQDIQQAWRNLPEKQKGDLFETLVKAYLLLDPEYASKLKHVWLYREVPPAIAQKLKLPATDQGIDLIAETNDGEFWAIQCKYRQETDQSLTWREISTFTGLTFGVCRGISFGIICSTTERITHVLKKQERIGFCALDVWQTLDADFFARLRARLASKPAPLKPAQPRPHQRAGIKAGHQHYVVKKAKRGKLIIPCGSGKSLAPRIGLPGNSTRAASSSPSQALLLSGRHSRCGCARRWPIGRRSNGFACAAMDPPDVSSAMTSLYCGKTSGCRASPLRDCGDFAGPTV